MVRAYLLHVPNGRGGRAAPLVLVFRGGGGHARNMPNFTKFDELADQEGFVVAYPDSFNKSWNDTRANPAQPEANSGGAKELRTYGLARATGVRW